MIKLTMLRAYSRGSTLGVLPAITLMALMMVGPGVVRAQDGPVSWVSEEKARLGVMLEERCEVDQPGLQTCDSPSVVSSVVVNGPADRAGVRAGDVLVAIDGMPIAMPAGRAALLDLKSGVPVSLELTRDGEKVTVEVTPEMRSARAYVDVRTRFVPAPAGSEPMALGSVEIVRVPSVEGRLDELEVRLDSLRLRGNDFVFFRGDSAGVLQVEVGGPEQAHVILERLREHEQRVAREIGSREGPNTDDAGRARERETAADRAELPRYVWENQELARRLVKVRDSSLQSARVHLDSLVRLHGQVMMVGSDTAAGELRVRVRTAPDGRWAYVVGPRSVPGELRTLLLSDFRVAGAEFRHLGGNLADYFDGVDDGLLVVRVIPGTPASRLGLREGDVVVEVEGRECRDVHSLRRAVAEAGPDGDVSLTWVRKGERQSGHLQAN